MSYTPTNALLKKYAEVIVHFGLNNGKGLKKGEVVFVWAKECTKPLFTEVCKEIWRSGGHVLEFYTPNEWERRGAARDFYELASPQQLDFFPEKFMRGLIDESDHQIAILGEADPFFLKGVDPEKIMRKGKALRPFMDWRNEKENQGKFTWTLALYGTPAMAKEARMTEKEYWQQIIRACFLDKADPVKEWRLVTKDLEKYRKHLSAITQKTEKFHIVGPDVDLWITPGDKRKWLAGGGANIPSFEIFTSPDWRGTNGWIRFNQPLYRYGNLVEGVLLEFKDGCVVKSGATKNEKVLKAMIATEGADKIGEFSLTDKRHSRITKFMAETLFDENIGGPQGNMHIALGNAYDEAYAGDLKSLTKETARSLGFNESSVHTDIITTASRTVTAHLKNGSEKIIYKNGSFVL